ncbi:MAG TPA: hypothetical protein PK661_10290 [Syntrophorhabdaceae bacterium]|jgi:hypothetical protein|nr:hypothetical protein [Syntrophorhabdaceae bacterium]MDI9561534.1 hypothetical protein [Pseudomonadota bacterium]HOS60474.1 hypothetical protein [Syntrophorhabdaceae bacterium]HPH41932.1 hypothetical protein [Syntrophorhabdaceae bacterium]HQG50135.1 hypothetical protein [Syntrophorhabdaceae bacterium]
MAKEKMVCPISKGMCVDCAIYRGRHYYLCFSRGYHGCLLESEEIEQLKNEPENIKDASIGFSDEMFKSLKCLENVEDVVIATDMHMPSV